MRPSKHHVRGTRGLLGVLLTALAALAALLTVAPAAQADTTICEQYGSTTIQNRYVVQNNRWGTSDTQCISVTDSGFRVTQADGSVPTNGAPKSYPLRLQRLPLHQLLARNQPSGPGSAPSPARPPASRTRT